MVCTACTLPVLVAVLARQWHQVSSVVQQCIAHTSVSSRRTVLALVEAVGVTFFFVGVFVGTFCRSAIAKEGVSIPSRGTDLPTSAPAKEKPGAWAGSGKLSGFNWFSRFTCFCGPSTSPAQRVELPLVDWVLGEPTGGGAGAAGLGITQPP